MNKEIDNVIERGIQRQLPVDLTEAELLEIARQRATAEAEVEEMTLDLQREVKRRKQQIEERQTVISRQGRELRTGQQDRVVTCTRRFVRSADEETCWVVLVRSDTGVEVSREPAPPGIVERHLQLSIPGARVHESLLDDARARQTFDEFAEEDEEDLLTEPSKTRRRRK